jgi:hypothetical protein
MKKFLVGILAITSLSAYASESFKCSVNKLSDSSKEFKIVVGKKVNAGKLSESGKFISFQVMDMDKTGDSSVFKGQYALTAWISDTDDASPMNNVEFIATTISKTQKVVQLQTGTPDNHLNVFCKKQ